MRGKRLLVIGVALAAPVVSCSDSTSPAPPITYTATLNAANERQANPVNSTATGTATFSLAGGDTLTFTITAAGLTANAIASHIHVGATTASGPIVNGFSPINAVTTGTVTSGTIILSKLVPSTNPPQVSGDSLRKLLDNGNAYVNVHTSTFTAGEIRGQIVRQ